MTDLKSTLESLSEAWTVVEGIQNAHFNANLRLIGERQKRLVIQGRLAVIVIGLTGSVPDAVANELRSLCEALLDNASRESQIHDDLILYIEDATKRAGKAAKG